MDPFKRARARGGGCSRTEASTSRYPASPSNTGRPLKRSTRCARAPGKCAPARRSRSWGRAVALALANGPALIPPDEPTGNLDSTNAAAIAGLLKSLSTDYGKTVIMVSHDAKAVEVFPTVYGMRDGRFVAAGAAA